MVCDVPPSCSSTNLDTLKRDNPSKYQYIVTIPKKDNTNM